MISFSDRRDVSRIVIRLHCYGRYCSFGPFSLELRMSITPEMLHLLTVGQETRFSEIYLVLLI